MKCFPGPGDILSVCTLRRAPSTQSADSPVAAEDFKGTIPAAVLAYHTIIQHGHHILKQIHTYTHTRTYRHLTLHFTKCPLQISAAVVLTGSRWTKADLTSEKTVCLTGQMVRGRETVHFW